jgi:hydrogenase nickel incorporation protein HypA/HybF
MHEFSYAEALLDTVQRRAAGRQVVGVRVRAGAAHRLDEGSLAQAFELVSAGSVAADAELSLVTLPMVLECRACQARSESPDALALCPACGEATVDVTSGEEFLLESIELAEPAADPA